MSTVTRKISRVASGVTEGGQFATPRSAEPTTLLPHEAATPIMPSTILTLRRQVEEARQTHDAATVAALGAFARSRGANELHFAKIDNEPERGFHFRFASDANGEPTRVTREEAAQLDDAVSHMDQDQLSQFGEVEWLDMDTPGHVFTLHTAPEPVNEPV